MSRKKQEIKIERARFTKPIRSLNFKHEGETRGMAIGPVWVQYTDGDLVNLVDGEPAFEPGDFFPEWFTKRQALATAKWLGVQLEEV